MLSADDLVMFMGDFNGHVGRHIDGFDGVHGGYGVGQRNFGRKNAIRVLSGEGIMCDNTWFKREENWKVTFRIGENETEIDFALMTKEHQRFIQNVKAIPGELQHALVIADIGKRRMKK